MRHNAHRAFICLLLTQIILGLLPVAGQAQVSEIEYVQWLSYYRLPSPAQGVAINGDVAYVAVDEKGMQNVNIGDPTDPTFHSYLDFYSDLTVTLQLVTNFPTNGFTYVSFSYFDALSGQTTVDLKGGQNDPQNPPDFVVGSTGAVTCRNLFEAIKKKQIAYKVKGPIGTTDSNGESDTTNTTGTIELSFIGIPIGSDREPNIAVRNDTEPVPDDSYVVSEPTGGIKEGQALGVTYHSPLIYVAAGDHALAIIQTSGDVISEIHHLNDYATGGPLPPAAQDVAVSTQWAYIADANYGLVIYNVFKPQDKKYPPWLASVFKPTELLGAQSVSYYGNLAFVVTESNGLKIVDVSDPMNPEMFVSDFDTIGKNTHDIKIEAESKLAYLANGADGLLIVDINDPRKPAVLGILDTPGTALAVDTIENTAGHLAFVADGSGGVRVVNVADPANPSSLGAFETYGEAYDVWASGDYAYVGDKDSDGRGWLNIFDAAAPDALPFYADFSALPRVGTEPLEVTFTDRSVGNIVNRVWDFGDGTATVIDPVAPITHTYQNYGSYDVTLTIYDSDGETTRTTKTGYITVNPASVNPPSANFTATPTSGDTPLVVTFTDTSTGYVTSREWDFDGDGQVDATNPTEPIQWIYKKPGTYTVTLTAKGLSTQEPSTRTRTNYITVTGSMPSEIGEWEKGTNTWRLALDTTGECHAIDALAFDGDVDYDQSPFFVKAAFGDGTDVRSFSYGYYDFNTETVEILTSQTLNQLSADKIVDIAVSNGVISVGTSGYGLRLLQFVDGFDGQVAIEVGQYSTGTASILGVDADDDGYVYLALGSSGVKIINVKTPSSPSLAASIGGLDTAGNVSVFVGDDGKKYLYVANGWKGVSIYDVTKASSPKLVGSVDSIGPALDVAAFGTTAYVAAGQIGLLVLDISKPSAPKALAQYRFTGWAKSVAILDSEWTDNVDQPMKRLAMVGCGEAGLMIVDATEPTNPVLRGSFNTDGNVERIALLSAGTQHVNGSTMLQVYIGLADAAGGVSVVRYDHPLPLVTVAAPSGSTALRSGSAAYVEWNVDETASGSDFVIQLCKGSKVVATLGEASTSGGLGMTNVLVPNTVPSGADYRLRVVSKRDASLWGESTPVMLSNVSRDIPNAIGQGWILYE